MLSGETHICHIDTENAFAIVPNAGGRYSLISRAASLHAPQPFLSPSQAVNIWCNALLPPSEKTGYVNGGSVDLCCCMIYKKGLFHTGLGLCVFECVRACVRACVCVLCVRGGEERGRLEVWLTALTHK